MRSCVTLGEIEIFVHLYFRQLPHFWSMLVHIHLTEPCPCLEWLETWKLNGSSQVHSLIVDTQVGHSMLMTALTISWECVYWLCVIFNTISLIYTSIRSDVFRVSRVNQEYCGIDLISGKKHSQQIFNHEQWSCLPVIWWLNENCPHSAGFVSGFFANCTTELNPKISLVIN